MKKSWLTLRVVIRYFPNSLSMYPLTFLHAICKVMVFVHARNATVKTAMALRDLAASYGDLSLFSPEQSPQFGQAQKQVLA